MKKSVSGTIYYQFENNPVAAIKYLRKVKTGEAVNALYREDIGFIDLVWGEHDTETKKGFGLKHIIEKHEKDINELGFDIAQFIPIVVEFGKFNEKASDKDIYVFESDMFRFVVDTKYLGKKRPGYLQLLT